MLKNVSFYRTAGFAIQPTKFRSHIRIGLSTGTLFRFGPLSIYRKES
jgi:hypothetical protein